MISLKDYAKKSETEAQNKSNTGFPGLYRFETPKTGKKHVFKARILPSICDGKAIDNELFFIESITHKAYQKKVDGKFTSELYCVCPTLFGKDCPICTKEEGKTKALISEIFQSYPEDMENKDKELYQELKSKKSQYAFIYVTEDSSNPDNVGKIFRWYFSKTVKEKLWELYADEDVGTPYFAEKGKILKVVVTVPDQNKLNWNIAVLPKDHHLSELDVEYTALPSITEVVTKMEQNLKPYNDIVTDVQKILDGHKEEVNINPKQDEVKNEKAKSDIVVNKNTVNDLITDI